MHWLTAILVLGIAGSVPELSAPVSQAVVETLSNLPTSTPPSFKLAVPSDPEERILQAATYLRQQYPQDVRRLLEDWKVDKKHKHLKRYIPYLLGRAALLEGKSEEAQFYLSRKVKSDRPVLQLMTSQALLDLDIAKEQWDGAWKRARQLEKNPLSSHLFPEFAETMSTIALASSKDRTPRLERALKLIRRQKGLEESQQLQWEARLLKELADPPRATCAKLLETFPCAPLPEVCNKYVSVKSLPPERRFQRAMKLYRCWGYKEASQEFSHFLADSNFQQYQGESRYLLAEIHARKLRDDRARAFKLYSEIYKTTSSTGRKSEVLYEMARCQMNLEDYPQALKLFRQYLDDYPKGPHAERCRYYLGWLPYDHDDLEDALPGFEQYLSHHPRGELRSYIYWFKAWSLYRLGRYEEAIKGLAPLAQMGKDIVAGKAWYWQAQSWLHLKERDKAAVLFRKVLDRYPLSFYGVLSYRRLLELKEDAEHPYLTVKLPKYSAPTVETFRTLAGKALKEALAPIEDALYIGEVDLAREFFEPSKEAFYRQAGAKQRYTAMQAAMVLFEMPSDVRNEARTTYKIRGRYPTRRTRLRWMLEYPEAYLRIVQVEASKQGLPYPFLFGIMRQESRYRRAVISWADAMGLMQLIPSTAQKVAQELKVGYEREWMFTPEWNIKMAAGYLGMLAVDLRHQLILVAASYNAGPIAVRQFMGRNKGQPLDFLVEEIAYNQARNYCRKVSGHTLTYFMTYKTLEERKAILDWVLPPSVDYEIGTDVQF